MEYSDWRFELSESQECQCEGCDTDPCIECGENCHDVSEAKIDDVKYGKGKGWNQPDGKSMTKYSARHSYLKKNPPNVRSDRNKRFSAQNVVFYGHDKVERDRKAKHHASRGVPTRGIKKEISGKDTSIDLKTEGLLNFIQTGVRRHNKSINQKKIDSGKAVPYGNMLVNKGKEEVNPKKNPVVASYKLEGGMIDEQGLGSKIQGKLEKGFKKVDTFLEKRPRLTKVLDILVGSKGKGKNYPTKAQNDAHIQKVKNKNLGEHVEGGVSVETYTKGIQFHEVETIDIIKPEPLKPSLKAAEYSDWRVELDK
tara:strand:- start:246 stop:1175 length:930 start_codon:yes stop_codon:yes gene_type:complete